MAGSVSYINQPVSLISKASIRYEGILYSINPEEATITLSNVRSYGTEDRKVDKFLAPKETLYEYIIFKANDIKELVIDEPHNDPAIVTQGPSSNNNTFSGNAFGAGNESQSNLQANGLPESQSALNGTAQTAGAASVSSVGQANDRYRSRGSTPASSQARSPVSELSSSNKPKSDLNKLMNRGGQNQNAAGNFQSNGRTNNQNNNNNQRRVWDNNRVNNNQNNNQRRQGGYGGYNQQQNNNMNRRPNYGGYQNNNYPNNFNRGGFRRNDGMSQPRNGGYRNYNNGNYNSNYNNNRGMMRGGQRKFQPQANKKFDAALKTEFDFEKANQVFQDMVDKLDDLSVSANGGERSEKSGSEDKDEARTDLGKAVDEDGNFYDKTKSFFDKISCEAIERTKGNQKRFDWKQERKLNAETFGIKVTYRQHDGGYRRGPGLSFNNRNPNNQNRRFNTGNQQPRTSNAPRSSSP